VVSARGILTGNRGCLVDNSSEFVRHHRGDLWISCLTEYRGWRNPLTQPGRWTPLFFLDEAVALAAGHRPCGLCRRSAYEAYRNAVITAGLLPADAGASDLNRILGRERLRPGRGLNRAADRKLWKTPIETLPNGAVIVIEGCPCLLFEHRLWRFGFEGWTDPMLKPHSGLLEVLTPPSSVAALRHGYQPLLHPALLAT
jgi:hypothetical protein